MANTFGSDHIGFLDPNSSIGDINKWWKETYAKYKKYMADPRPVWSTKDAQTGDFWSTVNTAKSGKYKTPSEYGFRSDSEFNYFARLADNLQRVGDGKFVKKNGNIAWGKISDANKRQLVQNFGSYAIESRNDKFELSTLGKVLMGTAGAAIGAGLGSEFGLFGMNPMSGQGISPGINIGGNVVGNTTGGIASGSGSVTGGSGAVSSGGTSGGGSSGGGTSGGGGGLDLPKTPPGGGTVAGKAKDVLTGGHTIPGENLPDPTGGLDIGDFPMPDLDLDFGGGGDVGININNGNGGWGVKDVLDLFTSQPVTDVLEGIFRGLGSDEVLDEYKDLKGDFKQVPTWFYDQARGFASVGTGNKVGGKTGIPDLDLDNDGLPDRYNSVLDYIMQGTNRRGAKSLGGTADHAGSTADIMADAVSRTYATMWNQDLQSLLGGANIEFDYNKNVNNTIAGLFDSYSGAMGDKYAGYGQAAGGVLNWLNDYANS